MMIRDPSYNSSIPDHAREEDITAKHGAGRGKVVKNYYLGKSYVGRRVYKNGLLEHEWSYKNGKRHGWEYDWHEDGGLAWALPYENGSEHGTASVWGRSGTLLGSYTMDHGTGIDFWWIKHDGEAQLTEARVVVDNLVDGYEYWFQWGKPGVLWKEKWWSTGALHGIEREWSGEVIREGFPKYWIRGEEVDERTYELALKSDDTLMPFKIDENQTLRIFPPEVAAYLP